MELQEGVRIGQPSQPQQQQPMLHGPAGSDFNSAAAVKAVTQDGVQYTHSAGIVPASAVAAPQPKGFPVGQIRRTPSSANVVSGAPPSVRPAQQQYRPPPPHAVLRRADSRVGLAQPIRNFHPQQQRPYVPGAARPPQQPGQQQQQSFNSRPPLPPQQYTGTFNGPVRSPDYPQGYRPPGPPPGGPLRPPFQQGPPRPYFPGPQLNAVPPPGVVVNHSNNGDSPSTVSSGMGGENSRFQQEGTNKPNRSFSTGVIGTDKTVAHIEEEQRRRSIASFNRQPAPGEPTPQGRGEIKRHQSAVFSFVKGKLQQNKQGLLRRMDSTPEVPKMDATKSGSASANGVKPSTTAQSSVVTSSSSIDTNAKIVDTSPAQQPKPVVATDTSKPMQQEAKKPLESEDFGRPVSRAEGDVLTLNDKKSSPPTTEKKLPEAEKADAPPRPKLPEQVLKSETPLPKAEMPAKVPEPVKTEVLSVNGHVLENELALGKDDKRFDSTQLEKSKVDTKVPISSTTPLVNGIISTEKVSSIKETPTVSPIPKSPIVNGDIKESLQANGQAIGAGKDEDTDDDNDVIILPKDSKSSGKGSPSPSSLDDVVTPISSKESPKTDPAKEKQTIAAISMSDIKTGSIEKDSDSLFKHTGAVKDEPKIEPVTTRSPEPAVTSLGSKPEKQDDSGSKVTSESQKSKVPEDVEKSKTPDLTSTTEKSKVPEPAFKVQEIKVTQPSPESVPSVEKPKASELVTEKPKTPEASTEEKVNSPEPSSANKTTHSTPEKTKSPEPAPALDKSMRSEPAPPKTPESTTSVDKPSSPKPTAVEKSQIPEPSSTEIKSSSPENVPVTEKLKTSELISEKSKSPEPTPMASKSVSLSDEKTKTPVYDKHKSPEIVSANVKISSSQPSEPSDEKVIIPEPNPSANDKFKTPEPCALRDEKPKSPPSAAAVEKPKTPEPISATVEKSKSPETAPTVEKAKDLEPIASVVEKPKSPELSPPASEKTRSPEHEPASVVEQTKAPEPSAPAAEKPKSSEPSRPGSEKARSPEPASVIEKVKTPEPSPPGSVKSKSPEPAVATETVKTPEPSPPASEKSKGPEPAADTKKVKTPEPSPPASEKPKSPEPAVATKKVKTPEPSPPASEKSKSPEPTVAAEKVKTPEPSPPASEKSKSPEPTAAAEKVKTPEPSPPASEKSKSPEPTVAAEKVKTPEPSPPASEKSKSPEPTAAAEKVKTPEPSPPASEKSKSPEPIPVAEKAKAPEPSPPATKKTISPEPAAAVEKAKTPEPSPPTTEKTMSPESTPPDGKSKSPEPVIKTKSSEPMVEKTPPKTPEPIVKSESPESAVEFERPISALDRSKTPEKLSPSLKEEPSKSPEPPIKSPSPTEKSKSPSPSKSITPENRGSKVQTPEPEVATAERPVSRASLTKEPATDEVQKAGDTLPQKSPVRTTEEPPEESEETNQQLIFESKLSENLNFESKSAEKAESKESKEAVEHIGEDVLSHENESPTKDVEGPKEITKPEEHAVEKAKSPSPKTEKQEKKEVNEEAHLLEQDTDEKKPVTQALDIDDKEGKTSKQDLKKPRQASRPGSVSPRVSTPKKLPSTKSTTDSEDEKSPKSKLPPQKKGSSTDEEEPKSTPRKRPTKKRPKEEVAKKQEGDHDSGVDESTQGNETITTNGVLGSPSKSPSKIHSPKKQAVTSPTKTPLKSPIKTSAKSTPRTPDTAASTTAAQPEKKKVPMNKVQVGAAPSPNLKTVRSKIGSLDNASYKPGGGKVKIEHRKLDFSKTQPKIAAKNEAYVPGGGDKKITQVKLQWNAKPKVGSLENATHKPGGGDKKIETVKLDFKDKAKPKIGSKDNVKHVPGGGSVKTTPSSQEGTSTSDIENQKVEFKAQSKVGSLANVKYKPGGGDVKIFDDKSYLKQLSGGVSRASSEGRASGAQVDKDQRRHNLGMTSFSEENIRKASEKIQGEISSTFPQTPPFLRDSNMNPATLNTPTEEIAKSFVKAAISSSSLNKVEAQNPTKNGLTFTILPHGGDGDVSSAVTVKVVDEEAKKRYSRSNLHLSISSSDTIPEVPSSSEEETRIKQRTDDRKGSERSGLRLPTLAPVRSGENVNSSEVVTSKKVIDSMFHQDVLLPHIEK